MENSHAELTKSKDSGKDEDAIVDNPEQEESGTLALWIDFNSAAEQQSVVHANQMIVQMQDHEFFLSFFLVSPLVLLGTKEEQLEQLAGRRSVQPECVARINISPRTLRETINALLDNLKKYEAYEARAAEDAKAKD